MRKKKNWSVGATGYKQATPTEGVTKFKMQNAKNRAVSQIFKNGFSYPAMSVAAVGASNPPSNSDCLAPRLGRVL